MSKKKSVTKAEAARRASQSQKDKSVSRTMGATRTTKSNASKKKRPTGGAGDAYSRLVLNPCTASFGQSNMPGSSGGQCIRLPYRQIAYVPSATNDINGTSGTFTACDTLTAVLIPHAMCATTAPAALSITSLLNETQVLGQQAAAGYFISTDPSGLSALNNVAGQMRPVAACLKVSCLGSEVENSGSFFGYEGEAKNIIKHSGGAANSNFYPAISGQNIMFAGKAVADTYKSLEVDVNIPNADSDYLTWRRVDAFQTAAGGIYRSGDAADQEWSNMPIAIAGVTSAKPGCKYLFEGAIVYEWLPQLITGFTAPPKTAADSSAFDRSRYSVSNVARSLGGMLIRSVNDAIIGGNAGAYAGLLRQSYAAYTSAQGSARPRLGW